MVGQSISYIGTVTVAPSNMGRKRNEESGQYTTNYEADDFISAIEDHDGMAGTKDIADAIGCTRRTAYTRLKELEEEGTLNSREIGSALVWTVPDED